MVKCFICGKKVKKLKCEHFGYTVDNTETKTSKYSFILITKDNDRFLIKTDEKKIYYQFNEFSNPFYLQCRDFSEEISDLESFKRFVDSICMYDKKDYLVKRIDYSLLNR
jgi:hypothetical protein